MRTFIIAEAGVNHNGQIELAKQLSAEKEAETEQLFPFAVRFGTLKFKGDVNGGFKVIDVPHAVIVNVPVDGGLLKSF
jgi:hypothetical protein